MKGLFIKLCFFTAYYVGIINLFYLFTSKRQRVVTFHNVIPDNYFYNSIEQGVSCTETVFKVQLKEIAKKFEFTTEINKKNSCMITFDDGYLNNYTIAIPILEINNIKAVFFITYDLAVKTEVIWIDLIMKWYSYVPEGRYSIIGKELNILKENRKEVFNQILVEIYNDYSLRYKVLVDLEQAFSFTRLIINDNYNRLRFCPISLINIEKMKINNHLVASHTISHDILSNLSDKSLNDDIKESESYLFDFYNTNYFAYPFGGVKEVSKKVLKKYSESKFNYCFVNYWNFFGSSKDESVQRITLPNTENKYVIHAYLSGFYFFFKRKVNHV